MSSLVILLLQQQARISIFVIVAAALAFAAGLALVIYFYRRFKEAEKQAPQDDWQAGMHALFVERPGGTGPSAARVAELDDDLDQPGKAVPRKVPVGAPPVATPQNATLGSEFVDDDFDQPGKAVPRKAPPVATPTATPLTSQGSQFDDVDFDQPGKAVPLKRPAVEPSSDARPLGSASPGSTQLFAAEIQTQKASDAAQESVKPPEAEVAGTRVLSSLPAPTARQPEGVPGSEPEPPVEHRVTPQAASKQPTPIEHPVPQPPIPAPPPPADLTFGSPDTGQTRKLASSDLSAEVRAPRATSLFGTTDRSRATKEPPRESYEPPAVTPIKRREAYEPPTIQPLEPRDEMPAAGAKMIPPAAIKPTRVEAAPPPVMPSKVSDREVARSSVVNQVGAVVPAAASKAGQERIPTGSILGLPATASKVPLRYGVPSRPTAETGIDSLVHYGRPADAGGGRTGTVVLAALLVLMAAAVAVYFFVPSLNSRVNNWLAEVRSVGPEGTLPADPPHANIFPSRRPEVLTNTVKARGAVDNISPQTLENLSLEITLGRPGGATETLRIPINPSSLAPGQRGTYEFEYDKSMGFREYRIVKLWSGDTELRYSSPAQDQGAGATTAAAPPASR